MLFGKRPLKERVGRRRRRGKAALSFSADGAIISPAPPRRLQTHAPGGAQNSAFPLRGAEDQRAGSPLTISPEPMRSESR